MALLAGPFRRILKVAVLTLTFTILVGATYQGVATALERRQFPYPGRLVDIGGYQLHLHCVGEGMPTVVLEAPAAGLSVSWAWVQPEVAKTTRVCSYDRAGLGWSQTGDGRFDPDDVPRELHVLLANADEHGPFILAGQGLGAAFAKLFASHYREDVAALVLVDAPRTDGGTDEPRGLLSLVHLSPWLARTGVLRATRLAAGQAAGLPPEAAGSLQSFLNRPDHLTRAGRELAAWDSVLALADQSPLGALPVRTIEAAGHDRLALLNEADQAARATAEILSAVAGVRAD